MPLPKPITYEDTLLPGPVKAVQQFMGLVKPIPVRGLLRLHSAVPAEPPVGSGRPTSVKAPEQVTVPALKNPVLLVLSRALAIRPAAPKSGQPSAAFTPGMTSAELVKMPRKTAAP